MLSFNQGNSGSCYLIHVSDGNAQTLLLIICDLIEPDSAIAGAGCWIHGFKRK